MESISIPQLKSLFEQQKAELKRKLGVGFDALMLSQEGRDFIRQTAADQAAIRAIQLMGLHEEDEAALVCDIILRFVAV